MTAAARLIDHDKIRAWVESQNGRPSRVVGTGGDGDPGILRIDLDAQEDKLEPVPWEDWFEAFERNQLALLVGPDSRFNKLVAR